jgi:hypothetical protein
MPTKFGFGGLNSNLNSNNNTISTNLGLAKDSISNLITVGRVIDIVLDENHPKFKELGEYSSLGTIEFVDTQIQSPTSSPDSSKLYAKPLFSNVKNYPIFNEIVYIISLPNQGVMENGASRIYYYFNSINVWNHPHHNAVPFFVETNSQNTQNKNYQVTSLGSTNKSLSTATSVNLGPGFKEYSNIHPLTTYLGDYILEGRWGNSIRIGSTVKSNANNWSTNGENGNPIMIIRNGQPKDASKEGWLPITEDINKDLSSIYLTSNQKIPIKPAQSNYKSYISDTPTKPDQYIDNQIILNSNRLLFNSNKDHILFNSALTVGFNSVKGFNFDTPATFIVDAKTIKLGDKNTTNPMLKGNETINTLNVICDQLIKLSVALSALVEILPPAPQVAVNIAASEAVAQIGVIKGNLNNLKSKTNFLI